MTEDEEYRDRTDLTVVAVGCPSCDPLTRVEGPRRDEGHLGVRFGERGPMVLSATVEGVDVRGDCFETDARGGLAWLWHGLTTVEGVRIRHACCRCGSRCVCVVVVSGDVRVIIKRPPRRLNFA